jgi:hypothetical protein
VEDPQRLAAELADAYQRLNDGIRTVQRLLAEQGRPHVSVERDGHVLTWDGVLRRLTWDGRPLLECSCVARCTGVTMLDELGDKLGVPR